MEHIPDAQRSFVKMYLTKHGDLLLEDDEGGIVTVFENTLEHSEAPYQLLLSQSGMAIMDARGENIWLQEADWTWWNSCTNEPYSNIQLFFLEASTSSINVSAMECVVFLSLSLSLALLYRSLSCLSIHLSICLYEYVYQKHR